MDKITISLNVDRLIIGGIKINPGIYITRKYSNECIYLLYQIYTEANCV